MAANFWASTQRRHWLFSREKLAETRDRLRDRDKVTHSQFPLPDQRLLNIYFNQRKHVVSRFTISSLLMILRTYQTGKAHVHSATGHRDRSSIPQKILY